MDNNTKELIDKFTEKYTLMILHNGSDSINYSILKLVPTTIPQLMDDFNLTKMPVNSRINKLEKSGLIRRIRGNGIIEPTELTPIFIELIDGIKSEVIKKLPQFMDKTIK